MSQNERKRVCIIGAGPSGMSALIHFDKLKKAGGEIPEIVCFESQKEIGGLWNYTWKTGTDEYGDTLPNSMYHNLWSNSPKEGIEFPDYTFQDHFKKPIPSFPPRKVLFDYLKGRWINFHNKSRVHLSHRVYNVQYNKTTDDFTVVVKNKATDTFLPRQKFDYVIVATGHFSVPNLPEFPGMEEFPGRILHSHDFRDARQFTSCRVLLIGSNLSAEDIALQCSKYGAKSVVCSWRTKPMGFKWPPQVTERPLATKFDGKTVHFRDGSQAEFDVIILCTGYLYSFPFLDDDIRLKTENIPYPNDLYRSVLWTKGANNKLMFLGMTTQYWSYTYFDVQAKWCVSYIMGENKLPSGAEIEKEHKKWIDRCNTLKELHDKIDFQGDLINLLVKESNYGADLDVRELHHMWVTHKKESIVTYRDRVFTSKYTGVKSPIHHTVFMEAMDDTIECFVGQKSNLDRN